MSEPDKSASSASGWERLTFTLDGRTEQILKFQGVDAWGQHRDISQTEQLKLAKQFRGPGVEALLEGAFEAGIASLLDDGNEHAGGETEDEIGIRRVLLRPLIEDSFAARALQRETLRKAVLQTLIQDFAGAWEPTTEQPKAPEYKDAAPKAAQG